MKYKHKPIAVSMGDPGGIGLDVLLLAWNGRAAAELPDLVFHGAPAALAERAAQLGIDASGVAVQPVSAPVSARCGEPDKANAAVIIESIDNAVSAVMAGDCGAVVTLPIAKKPLYEAGFTHPGHTEYLAELAQRHTGQPVRPVMMIAGPDLRTVPVTIHIPLSQVMTDLTTDLIVETARITAADLARHFGIARPRLAVAGLNPHAGEGGTMGTEDEALIAPAIRQLQAEGIDAFGPLPADTMFHARARAGYDAALCMYHDQALIPAKTLAFDDGVNVTLGLPFIRTSPDHGTAFDIAGTGKARPDSFIAALRLAADMAERP